METPPQIKLTYEELSSALAKAMADESLAPATRISLDSLLSAAMWTDDEGGYPSAKEGADSCVNYVLSEINLASARHPEIGGLIIENDYEARILKLGQNIPTTVNRLVFTWLHVSDCHDAGEDGKKQFNFPDPWAIGIAEGDDDVDYQGTYCMILADLLCVVSNYL